MNCILKGELVVNKKIKRSEFITHLFCVDSVDAVKQRVRQVARQHKNASHNCWAYIVGESGEVSHFSDDGEPSGTAGKPMMGALLVRCLTNVCVVVTRYFGGVKLGVPGLIDAYSSVVAEAIEMVGTQELIPQESYCLSLSYDRLDTLNHRLQSLHLQFVDVDYSHKVSGKVVVPKVVESEFLALLGQMRITYQKVES